MYRQLPMKILILCTGNSCRSQMAESFLKSLDITLQVFSAGTKPTAKINPYAVKVMKEYDIDISQNSPKLVDKFLSDAWDYVITVCGWANENCPHFMGTVKKRLHMGFDDPADIIGTEDEIMKGFRKVRDEIKHAFTELYHNNIKK